MTQKFCVSPVSFNLKNSAKNKLKIICYADETIIMAKNEDDLERLLKQLEEMALEYKQIITTKQNTCKLVVNKQKKTRVRNGRGLFGNQDMKQWKRDKIPSE